MEVEADTKSPWNEGHIGTGEGHNGVTDANIGQAGYSDAQCTVNIGSLRYNMYTPFRSVPKWMTLNDLRARYKPMIP